MPDENPKLWRLLAQAISGRPTSLRGFDDVTLLRSIYRHGVGPLLQARQREGTVAGLSEAMPEQLAEDARSQAALDLLLNDSTRRFLSLLHANGIPALLLKGTPVAHLFYPETWLRPRCDTDVLIGEADKQRAMELLRAQGYRISGQLDRRYSSKQFVASINPFQQTHTNFDVHWKLSNRVLFQSTLTFEECLEQRQPVPALGEHAWTLSTVGLLLHACIHRIAHGRNTERDRLIWLYDIHLLAEAVGKNGRVDLEGNALKRQVGFLCADALETAQGLFGTRLGSESLSRLRSNPRQERSAKLLHSSKLRWVLADLQALKGIKQKAAFTRELLPL